VAGFVLFDNYFWPTITLGLVELATMLGTVLWVHEGRAAKPREGRRWTTIARETWATDVLRQRSYVWLIASRFFFLTAAGMLINTQVFYLERSLGIEGDEKAFWIGVTTVIFGVTALIVTLPSARISDRVGRKPVIWAACLFGGVGLGLVTIAPTIALVLPGVALLAAASGIFLAVDWAFMTDIVPKISAGRYMGLSNVATASATAAAPALGGIVIWVTTLLFGLAAGPRFAEATGIVLFAIAALLLRPVYDRVYEARRAAELPRRPEVVDAACEPVSRVVL
jgi:MFS family permease